MIHRLSSPTPPSRVVVFGASGFVGKALCDKLGAEAVPCVQLGSQAIDLTDEECCRRLPALLRPSDAVVFCSALTPEKGKDSATLIRNLKMAHGFSTAIQTQPVAHSIYISSDAVYEESPNPLREETTPAPATLYATMHLAREKIFQWAASKKCPLLILRPCAIYGPGDTHNSYGPNRFMREAKRSQVIPLFGGGEEIRHHLFIHDFIEVIWSSLIRRSEGVLNVAGLEPTSFMAAAEKVQRSSPAKVEIRTSPRQNPITHKFFDLTLLMKEFQGVRFTSLGEGVAKSMPHM